MAKTEAVIFDYDGVIADGFEANFLGWEKCFREHGLRGFNREFFRTVYGSGARNIARPILAQNGVSETEQLLLELIRQKAKYANEHITRITLIPDVEVFLKRLTGKKLAIATGNSRALIESLNIHFQIEHFFDLVIGSEDVSPNQADPKGFLIAAHRLGLAPTQCLVVEDAPSGVEAAKRCRVKCLAITSSKPRAMLAAADRIIDTYAELSEDEIRALLAG